MREVRLGAQRVRIGKAARQLRIGQRRMNGAVADRMERLHGTATPAFGQRMMPFHPPP